MTALVLLLGTLVGLLVGLLGGGGSVLTVPLLTLGLGMDPARAISMSLLVVMVTSAAGVVSHARAGRVWWSTALAFGPAGMAGAIAGGWVGGQLPGRLLMVLFGAMMAVSAWSMLRPKPAGEAPAPPGPPPVTRLAAVGLGVGLLTGMVGAGGGFVIVPALVGIIGLPVHAAVGTSLVVITMNSAAALVGRLGAPATLDLDWTLTATLAACAALAAVVGGRLAGRVPQAALRRGFGWLVIAIAALILVDQAL